MSTLTFFKGKKGPTGDNGLDGVDVDDVRVGLLDNPLLSMFAPNAVSNSVVTWSRYSGASVVDRYGGVQTVGGDNLENLFDYSNDFTQWIDAFNRWSVNTTGNLDPLGGNNGTELVLDATFDGEFALTGVTFPATAVYTLSFWIRKTSGTINSVGATINVTTLTATEAITGTYQRIELSFLAPSGGTSISLNMDSTVGTKFILFGAQLESGAVAKDYIETTGSPASIPNPENRWRSNELGYYIEQQGTNLVPFSEDLGEISEWSIAGGTVTTYTGTDVFGETDKRIKLTAVGGSTITLSGGGTYAQGESYTVSLWAKLISGSVSSIIASLGNGGAAAFTEEITNEFVRFVIEVTAGSDNGITLSVVSPNADGVLLVEGVQAELGGLSTYIRTADISAVRTSDNVTVDYSNNFVKPDLSWTILFTIPEYTVTTNDHFIFHNGESAGDEFYCKLNDGELIVKNGDGSISFNYTAGNTELIFDGSTLSYYSDANLIDSSIVSSTANKVGSTLNVCSDSSSLNQLDTPISLFCAYDEQLTVNELRYIRGSDHDNNG